MRRRGFLGFLTALVAAPKVVASSMRNFPLTTPVPAPPVRGMRVPLVLRPGLTPEEVANVELERVRSKIPILFERDDHFFAQIDGDGGKCKHRHSSRRGKRGR